MRSVVPEEAKQVANTQATAPQAVIVFAVVSPRVMYPKPPIANNTVRYGTLLRPDMGKLSLMSPTNTERSIGMEQRILIVEMWAGVNP